MFKGWGPSARSVNILMAQSSANAAVSSAARRTRPSAMLPPNPSPGPSFSGAAFSDMLISNPVRVLRSEESGIVVVWAGEVEGSKWAVRARSPTPDHQVGSRSAGSAVSGDIWATCEERRVCGCISPASGRGEGKAVPAMACAELFCAQGQPARRNWGRYDLLVPHPSLA